MLSYEQKRAAMLLSFLILLLLVAAFWLFHTLADNGNAHIARISRDGVVLHEIDLDQVEDVYTITIHGTDGNYNIIEVRPGSIGMIEATCPDHLCIQMGFIYSDALPVTCLPNRVVIQIFGE